MTQLDKFTYFTQFFWSCLFLILLRFYLPLDLQVKVDFYYITRPKLRRALSILKFFIYLLFLLSFVYKIYHHVFDGILLHSLFGIVPFELLLLDHYINQPDKDPEWMEFVRQGLQTQGLSPREYEVMVRNFLETEFCFSTRDQISSLYQLIYYGWEDPQFFIDPQDLDSILRTLNPLNSITWLYARSWKACGFLKQKHQAQLEMHHRRELVELWKSLERRNTFLSEEKASLREKLFLLDREAP
ncbi:hypothetical protein R3W88_011631 [Solanum pinnatisectum]|uniref:ATP synthase YMF19-like N-terminal domain-containing protein n=1 Tax=Solanum pinnatisectum TaxID=50273 RepID=A0AAV9L796_9SOLN|nr:hypothetical protein R3W88_011631 [Solanum pinnatisectum]